MLKGLLVVLLVYLLIGIVYCLIMAIIKSAVGLKLNVTGMKYMLLTVIVWPLDLILVAKIVTRVLKGDEETIKEFNEYCDEIYDDLYKEES